ncbi:hypothetical protein HWD35_16275 [Tsukamurella tyrosinosolvens]|uniref:hypothetical protein n=1 Tax=Tsukamurella tyrosinosolvens TaxID=57704 RepID=UPI001CE144F7|nr:hypothetical protein [Tsukamurella tyrosinosolvens]MCA4996276.1 hypothetical protein [Tsukamurella tyrosinosolvens]
MNRQIAEGIVALRGRRSAQWLSDRTAELGHRVSRAAISNFENHRKKSLDIADLLVIAKALQVGLVDLIYPDPASPEVWVAPNEPLPAWRAAQELMTTASYANVIDLHSILYQYRFAKLRADRAEGATRSQLAETAIVLGEQAIALYDKLEPKVWPWPYYLDEIEGDVPPEHSPEEIEADLLSLRTWVGDHG